MYVSSVPSEVPYEFTDGIWEFTDGIWEGNH